MKPIASYVLFGLLIIETPATTQGPSSKTGGKMEATAIVVLTREFCTAQVKNRTYGTEFFAVGRLLCPAAEEAVRNSFERVIRMETAPKPEDAGGHLVLIPRYADMEATVTATLVGKRAVALLVEWTATDPGGNILWVQTVEGDARKATGFNHIKLMEMAARDVAVKSAEAIQNSQEIRQFLQASTGK